MKLSNLIPQKKLRAATAVRRAPQPHALEDQEEEPTMSLGAASIVVLILHVVAIGGVYAFSSVKAHHPGLADDPSLKTSAVAKTSAPVVAPITAKPVLETPAVVETPVKRSTTAAASEAPVRKPVTASNAEAPKKPMVAATTAAAAADSREAVKESPDFHIVAKGDSLLSVARKRHVLYADLVKLNKIEDPTKLKIGQKLRLPVKPKTASN